MSNLNEEQRAAAHAPLGHNLIIASAGTGKTSTIVARIEFLLNSNISPNEILLLTFTNKASAEMIARLGAKFPAQIIKQIEAGTFHSVAYRYLKERENICLKQPKELKILFKTIYERRVFLGLEKTKPYGANYLYDLFSLFQNSSRSGDFKEYLQNHNEEQMAFYEIYEDVITEFFELKKAHNYVDYNDLLLLFKEYAQKESQNSQNRFNEILVDEYQDTNPLQESIISALNPRSLFCVGDYDQSIYAFNGADIGIIGSFKERYENAKIFALSKNYRSSAPILALANKVIQKNERLYPKSLEVTRTGSFAPPSLLIYDDLFLQYQGIANKIKLSNLPHSQTAVIFRNNSSGDGIEASLREQGVKCKRKGGNSFFESREVSVVLGLCGVLYNSRDMMSFVQILSFAKGIGNTAATDIYEALHLLGNGSIIKGFLKPDLSIKEPYKKRVQNTQLGLFDDFFQIENAARFNDLPAEFAQNPILNNSKISKEGAEFLALIWEFFKNCEYELNPRFLINKIRASGLFNNIKEKLSKERAINKDGSISQTKKQEAKERIERKVGLLYELAARYEDLGRFLNAMVLGSSEMSEGEGVNLLSIHAAKGLEFDRVFVVDLMDGRFPNKSLINKGGSLEEERRLFYVAATRAKNELILSYAKKDALKNTQYEPSIFLFESGLLKKEDFV